MEVNRRALTVNQQVKTKAGGTTDNEYCRYGNSSGRGKGGSVICFENITYELW
jgi:hypothetical protein